MPERKGALERLPLPHTTKDPISRICMLPHLIAAEDESSGQSRKQAVRSLTNVAAHVQAETMPDAISPGLTLRDALLNSSELFSEKPV